MDRTHPQVAAFAASLAAIDDDTLAALANKGLVRRARKDIEKSPPRVIAADEQTVSLEVVGCTTRVTNPPGKSTCSCASGICRHILGAIIFLRESAAPAGAAEPPPPPRAADGADP